MRICRETMLPCSQNPPLIHRSSGSRALLDLLNLYMSLGTAVMRTQRYALLASLCSIIEPLPSCLRLGT